MTCKDVKDFVSEYEKVTEEVKSICTDRACTLDVIQKALSERGMEIGEAALTTVMSQIRRMMVFQKDYSYDIGSTIIYRRTGIIGIINSEEMIGNEIARVLYKNFYLYSSDRYNDDAFREYIYSKLKFEEAQRVAIVNSENLKNALESLGIEHEKWTNYVVVSGRKVSCQRWDPMVGCPSTKHLGKFIRQVPIK